MTDGLAPRAVPHDGLRGGHLGGWRLVEGGWAGDTGRTIETDGCEQVPYHDWLRIGINGASNTHDGQQDYPSAAKPPYQAR